MSKTDIVRTIDEQDALALAYLQRLKQGDRAHASQIGLAVYPDWRGKSQGIGRVGGAIAARLVKAKLAQHGKGGWGYVACQ